MERLGDQGTQAPLEMRVNLESLDPQERREKLAMRGTQGRTVPPEKGAGLESKDSGEPLACGAQEETRVKLDHRVTREEKAPLAFLETRVRLAPLDLKDTEVMKAPQASRAPEDPLDPLGPLETQG